MSSIRSHFENELKELQQDLLNLCERSISALEMAFASLIEKDMAKAQEVIDKDIEINKMEEIINDKAISIITRQQPVATDLRRIAAIIKAASDMERVADYGVNIAKEAKNIGQDSFVTSVELLEDMSVKSVMMLRQMVEAFVEENTTKAREIARMDDQIDEMYENMIRHLMQLSSVQPNKISQITNLAFISRYIERSADHATNIAEHLIYLKKGLRADLN